MTTINATGTRLATIDVWHMPDGHVEPRLRYMDPSGVDTSVDRAAGGDVAERLRLAAEWTMSAAAWFEKEAGRVGE